MVGPGAILATALVAPFAMSTSAKARVPAFLTALMVANGANAGNLSPVSTLGVIVNGLMSRAGMGGHEYRVWFYHVLATCFVAAAAWFLFGGVTLLRAGRVDCLSTAPKMQSQHAVTLVVTAAWIGAVLIFRAPIGPAAIVAAALLIAFRFASAKDAIRRMPWKTILLVVCISTVVAMLDRAGGLRWFQDLVTRVSTPKTVHGVMAALTGLISAYSSTSGVVLPAFLPMVPGLALRFPGVNPLELSISVIIGSSLVDVSPLSTLGALCIAAAPPNEDTKVLYRNLFLWGLTMVPVGATLCLLLWSVGG
jgi:di/tricarboxylate transporter